MKESEMPRVSQLVLKGGFSLCSRYSVSIPKCMLSKYIQVHPIRLVSIVLMTLISFLLLSVLISMECHAASMASQQEVLEQLRVQLPGPIQKERVGTIESVSTNDTVQAFWLAKNALVNPYPMKGPSGNVIYLSSRRTDGRDWTTRALPIGSRDFKERLQAIVSNAGSTHIYWVEDGLMNGCIYSNGEFGTPYQISNMQVNAYSLDVSEEGVEIYFLSGTTIYWLRDHDGTIAQAPSFVRACQGDVSNLSAARLGDESLLSYIELNQTSEASALTLLLLDGADVLDNETVMNQSFKATDVILSRYGGTVLAIAYNPFEGRLMVHFITIEGGQIEVAGEPIGLETGHQMDCVQCVVKDAALHVYSINAIVYVGLRVQRYNLSLMSGIWSGPTNATPSELSPLEETFSVLESPKETFLVVSGLYKSGAGYSSAYFSKLVVYEGNWSDMAPAALLNPRLRTLPEVGDLSSLWIDGDGHWVAVATNANATWETHLYLARVNGGGNLTWMASTPWFSTTSYLEGQMVTWDGAPLVLCRSYFDADRDQPQMTIFEYKREGQLLYRSAEVEHLVVSPRPFNTWHCAVLGDKSLVISRMSTHEELTLTYLEPGTWRVRATGQVSDGRDIKGHYVYALGGLVHLVTFERSNDATSGLIREISLEGSTVQVLDTWTLFNGGYYEYSDILARRVGPAEIAVVTKHNDGHAWNGVVYLFNQSSGELEPPIEVGLPKDYELYGMDISPYGGETLLLAAWALDLSSLMEDGIYVLDLVLAFLDRSNPLAADVIVPLSVPSPNEQVVQYPLDVEALTGDPSGLVVAFTMYEVEPSTSSLFWMAYDPLEPGLSPISPPDGAFLNRTTILFSATPLGDIWESATEYRVVLYRPSEPTAPFIVSQWASSPRIPVTLPEGRYLWTMEYRRFHAGKSQDWRYRLVVDTTPPVPDAGGPYFNVSVGVPILLNGSGSWDENGIESFTWTIYERPPLEKTGAQDTVEFIPVLFGTTYVRLEVMDLAGNRAMASTVIVVRPPPPILEMTLPDAPMEGEAATLTCNVENQQEGIGYTYIWNLGFFGGTGPSVTVNFPDDGIYDISVKVWDEYNQLSEWRGTVAILNRAPELDPLPDLTIREFEPLHLEGVALDVAADPLSFSWTLDGMEVSRNSSIDLALDDGTYQISVSVADGSMATDTSSATITVTPWIPEVLLLQAMYEPKGANLTIRWFHEEEPDFVSLKIKVFEKKDAGFPIWEHTIGTQSTSHYSIDAREFPDTVYVLVVLEDDSLSSSSDILEAQRPERPRVSPNTPLLYLMLAVVIILALLSWFVLRRRLQKAT